MDGLDAETRPCAGMFGPLTHRPPERRAPKSSPHSSDGNPSTTWLYSTPVPGHSSM